MLTTDTIEKLFAALNEELATRGVTGEVGICGGAVMCLVFRTRCSTKDVDGIFAPATELREAISAVGRSLDVPEDWLNDAAKAFFTKNLPRQDILNYSHLRVWAPTAEYMLAMKCISARYDGYDREDLKFLVAHLKLGLPAEVFEIVSAYYPDAEIPAKTKFFVEELLQKA